MVDREEDAGEVHPDHRLPGVQGQAVGSAREHQAGAGDDSTEPADGGDDVGGGGHRRLIAHVAHRRERRAALADDLRRHRLGGAGAHVDHTDGRASGGEPEPTARPMPLPPPVTSARRPASRPMPCSMSPLVG